VINIIIALAIARPLGIALFHPCTDNTVTQNTARNNGEFDLYDDDSPVVNSFTDNNIRTASAPTLD
jgi:hypothetical protein